MQDRLKCKALIKNIKRWVHGYYLPVFDDTIKKSKMKYFLALYDETNLNHGEYGCEECASGLIEIDEKTICQFTGYKDDDGVDVYENDIVEIIFKITTQIGLPPAIVKYGEYDSPYAFEKRAGFYINSFKNDVKYHREELSYWKTEEDYDIKVIGNKFEGIKNENI